MRALDPAIGDDQTRSTSGQHCVLICDTGRMLGSSELGELITGYFASFTSGDPDWVERHVLRSDELRLIGTNAEEWLQGTDAFDVFRREAAAATGTLDASLSDVEAYSLGDVGWGAGLVRFAVPSGQTAQARFSVVFVAVDGTWKVVSSHTSIPVPDEDAFSAD